MGGVARRGAMFGGDSERWVVLLEGVPCLGVDSERWVVLLEGVPCLGVIVRDGRCC